MIDIRRLDSKKAEFLAQLKKLLSSTDEADEDVTQTVMQILREVKSHGDSTLLEYTNRFDQREASASDLEIQSDRLKSSLAEIPQATREALEYAAIRIRSYHERQKLESWSYEDNDGNLLGQQVTALNKVGVYVPGGKAAYPSSVLMNIIPARVAGVDEVLMVVPAPQSKVEPIVLAAASIAGVDRVFTIGGAQAIAALAYGTETIPAVDKIVGPGNRYVAEAKRLVFGNVGIDMVAGPSEVLIIGDGNTEPEWVAMDLFAQAEHDEEARAILVSTDDRFLDEVLVSMNKLLPELKRQEIVQASLEGNGLFVKAQDIDDALDIVNFIAPEHLELFVADPQALLNRVQHAGAIFMGKYSAEAMGDYCAGPNHVLPTAQTVRFSSPLGVYDFQKRSSLIMCSEKSVSGIAHASSVLARVEGLTAHAQSAELRITTKS